MEDKKISILLKKSIKNYVVVLLVIFVLLSSIFVSRKIFTKHYDVKNHPKNIFTGESGTFLTNVYPIFNDVLW